MTDAYRAQMEKDIGTPEPTGPMYQALGDPATALALIQEHGGAAWQEAVKNEIRAAMDEHGVRVVLWYGERMKDVEAVFEEFSD